MTEEEAVFRSHIDGRLVALSPERAVAIQEALGSDVAMVLDHVVGLPNSRRGGRRRDGADRSLGRGDAATPPGGPIRRSSPSCKAGSTPSCGSTVRGNSGVGFRRLRRRRAERRRGAGRMYRMLEVTVPELPADRPRYLMGVGRPEDLLEGIARGIDLFDCVMPTRNGRNAMAFTDEGSLRLRNLQFERDERPLQERLPLCGLPSQPGVSASPVHGQGDARARSCCRSTI